MDGVINSLLLFFHLAEDKKKRVAQIPTTPYFWMDGGTVHQSRPSFTSTRPMAALVRGKHPVPLTFFAQGRRQMGKGANRSREWNDSNGSSSYIWGRGRPPPRTDSWQLQTNVSLGHLTQAAAPFSLLLRRFPCLGWLGQLLMCSSSRES